MGLDMRELNQLKGVLRHPKVIAISVDFQPPVIDFKSKQDVLWDVYEGKEILKEEDITSVEYQGNVAIIQTNIGHIQYVKVYGQLEIKELL